MFDITPYIFNIQHDKGKDEEVGESSDLTAIKLDESNGLGVALGFTNNSLSKADFLHINNNQHVIIEASDLRDQLNNCLDKQLKLEEEELEKLKLVNPNLSKLPIKLRKDIEDYCYYPLKAEMMQKWCGSIAITERLCRVKQSTLHPDYSYIIVCKNGTDVKVLDRFKNKMSGSIKNIQVLTTETLVL